MSDEEMDAMVEGLRDRSRVWQLPQLEPSQTVESLMFVQAADALVALRAERDEARAEAARLRGALTALLPPEYGIHGGPLVGARAVYEDGTDEISARHVGWISAEKFRAGRAARVPHSKGEAE